MFHYGWARPAAAIQQKLEISKTIYPWGGDRFDREQARGHLEWIPLLRPFRGSHPAAAAEWIAARRHDPDRVIGPRRFRPGHLRFYVSDWLERLTGERWFEAELYRLKGQCLIAHQHDGRAGAEACFQHAISVAREQRARLWELRATISLARLWRDQGRRSKAKDLLVPMYGWFTEGFDTADLMDAKALLQEVS